MENIARATNFGIRGPSWTFVDLRGPLWNLCGTFVDLRETFVDLRGLQAGVIFALYITFEDLRGPGLCGTSVGLSGTFVGVVLTIAGLPAGFPSQAESTSGSTNAKIVDLKCFSVFAGLQGALTLAHLSLRGLGGLGPSAPMPPGQTRNLNLKSQSQSQNQSLSQNQTKLVDAFAAAFAFFLGLFACLGFFPLSSVRALSAGGICASSSWSEGKALSGAF